MVSPATWNHYEIAKNKIKVIEDCAQAHGSKYKNKFAGTFGDLVFPFTLQKY